MSSFVLQKRRDLVAVSLLANGSRGLLLSIVHFIVLKGGRRRCLFLHACVLACLLLLLPFAEKR